jgi:hypothetical protein
MAASKVQKMLYDSVDLPVSLFNKRRMALAKSKARTRRRVSWVFGDAGFDLKQRHPMKRVSGWR